MNPLVADASALLQLVLAEPGADVVGRLVATRRHGGLPTLVPMYFWLEVVNVLGRRYRLDGATVLQAIHALDRLGLESREMGRESVLQMSDLVERFALSAWDAGYLALADSTDADLVTADRELARAAGERAIWVGPGGKIAEPPAAYEVEPTWPSWRGAAAYLGELRRQAAEESAAQT